ncbi:iron uptake system protein EfeO [Streptomyces sp. TR06-5]|uniref:iron uptake system protein EfeO n=1 Tax=unclassified Streptomyces TaxID=2593676 RepID=UPI00399EF51C
MRAVRPAGAVAVFAVLGAAVAGCAQKEDPSGGGDAVEVTASDSACKVSEKEFPAGHIELAVENTGSKVTEVYVYGEGDRIVTERENIGPGTSVTITTQVEPGDYEIACKPGMEGDGIRQQVTATGDGAEAKNQDPRLSKAVAAYRTYVKEQAELTLPEAKKFVSAVKEGDLKGAKAAYAPSRVGWERTEPVAESFGDIDPKVDLREDGLTEGQKWTGWHRLEKALWQKEKIGAEEKKVADRLITDLEEWEERVGKADITPTSMANGAKELLDEVATGKVTGEEERYSHTDLVDFQANIEGAQKAYELLRPVAKENDPALVEQLDKRFPALFDLLKQHRDGDSFVSYEKVGDAERKKLSDSVNALAEPLSQLAAAVAPKA